MRFDPEVFDALRAIGWYPGRRLRADVTRWKLWADSEAVPVHPAAEAAWEEFGNLSFPAGGPGIDLARMPFAIGPLHAGDTGLLREAAEEIGEPLSPLGEIEHGKSVLLLCESGLVIALGDFDCVIGSSVDDALHRMVLGLRWPGPQPDWADVEHS